MIIISNSYWINDDQPCLTYGLRGVIHATVEISSQRQDDLHSGVDGGAYDEPLPDLIKLLSHLSGTSKEVLIPGFNENVRPLERAEMQMYRDLTHKLERCVLVANGRTGGGLVPGCSSICFSL